MPHQRGEHPSFGASRGGPPRDHPHLSTMQHVIDFQRRSVMGPRMIHHSPGSHHGMMQGPVGMFRGAHPHSPASWSYASSHASSPHRVPGGLSATSSGENLMEEQVANHRDCSEEERGYGQSGYDASPAMREKADIISEAIKRHLDDDRSIGTNEADAASALLFATTVVRHTESSKVSVAGEQHQSETEKVEAADEGQRDGDKPDKSSNPGTTEKEEVEMHESNVPLKKRRKLLNFVRKPNTTLEGQKNPLHVSPLPSPAGHSQGQDHGSSEETVATTSPQRTTTSSSTCFTSSYDTRGAQTLHDGSKIGDAVEITPPPSQVVIEFFPLLLHNVLSKSEFADNVLQWVSDGKAWKIVRWDALRRKVLPKYFSKLQDEDGNVGSSIDAFLYNVTSWGFEEVQEGPDVGAYAHDLFQKDSPELCRKMIFSPKQSDLESPTAAPKKTPSTISEKLKEATQPHSILQVPSLASSNRSVDGESHSKAGEKAMQWREEAEMQKRAMHSPTISYPMAGRPMHHPETPLYMGYRLNELAYAAEGLHFYPESPLTMRHLGIPGGLPGYGRRFSGHHDFEFGGQRVALHHSPRLHSGRGAMRLAAAPRVCATPDQMAQRRPSFPVSNRGKGNRINCSLRANLPSTASSVPTSICEMNTTPIEQHHSEESMGSQRFSEKVAERVAVAVSKKTKRKLPISSSKVESDKQQENDSEAKGAEQEFKVEAKRPKQETKPDVESAEQERISEAGSKKQQETEVESDKKASEPKETESRVEEETEKDENRVEEV